MRNPNELFIRDYEAEAKRIVKFIKNYIVSCPRKKIILGLSGGIDSAVAASLYCRAIGPKNVYVVLMPAPNSSEESVKDARFQAAVLKIPKENIYLRPLEKQLKAFGFTDKELEKGSSHIGNTAARLRMMRLFKIADEIGAIVGGTENRSEHLLAYFTIAGDEESHIEPTQHLYKWEIFGLAKHLKDVTPEIQKKKPSAEFYIGQTDEGELDFTYNDADILFACSESGNDPSEYGVVVYIKKKVLARVDYTEFKRKRPVHLERN